MKILELRKEKAKLLGFADFADLVLEDRMAHTGAKAQAFLDELRAKTEKRFKEDQELGALWRELRRFNRLNHRKLHEHTNNYLLL